MRQTKSRKLVAGEVDYKDHVLVFLPTERGGLERAWIKITSGDKYAGEGILDHEPKLAAIKIGKSIRRFKLGDAIKYSGGDGRILPHFDKFVDRKNHLTELKKGIAEGLRQAMYGHLVKA